VPLDGAVRPEPATGHGPRSSARRHEPGRVAVETVDDAGRVSRLLPRRRARASPGRACPSRGRPRVDTRPAGLSTTSSTRPHRRCEGPSAQVELQDSFVGGSNSSSSPPVSRRSCQRAAVDGTFPTRAVAARPPRKPTSGREARKRPAARPRSSGTRCFTRAHGPGRLGGPGHERPAAERYATTIRCRRG